jgi:peptide/nickel transport system substrate-binding protein
VSDKITRSDLLKRGGQVAAGAAAAGAIAGPASAAVRRRAATTPQKGGHVTWALEQDPVAMAPFGMILTSSWWGTEPMYEALLEWDSKLNLRPALAESYKVVSPTVVDWNIRKGVKFHDGSELTAADAAYSFGLQLNPPPPGSISVLGQVPKIKSVHAMGKYKLRMTLKTPDATLFGYMGWGRYSRIVPSNMYKKLNPVTQGNGTGPFKLVSYTQNDRVEYVRHPQYWKQGMPYLDALTLKVLTDEQARIAALRAGAIDGATVTPDSAKALQGDSNLQVLHGLTAAFRELQMTIKAGESKPWHDRRVRQAVNFAIDRQELIDKVYSGNGAFSGHIPPGYGPWPPSPDDLKTKYEKHDVAKAKQLMKDAGFEKGFSVTMTTFATPLDFQQVAALIKNQLKQINIDVNIVPQDAGTFAAANGKGTFDWDLTARGMRGDVNGYTAEFNPSNAIYRIWFSGYKNVPLWRLVGNGQITLDQQKRLPLYKKLEDILLTELIEVPLVAVSKFQVVNKRLQDMYVSFTDANPGLRNAWVKR